MASFRCGPYEVLKIAYEGHKHLEHLNATENLVLRGLRMVGKVP